jgi:membrane associated rhomboid family serine protease
MMFRLTPVVKFVLIAIVGLYLVTYVLAQKGLYLSNLLALHSYEQGAFKPFQVFTYMLMHSSKNFMHIFFNMFMFVSFGPQLETFLGSKRFGNFIMICGLGVGICWLGWNYLAFNGFIAMGHSEGAMVGFSGVLFGIFALMGLYFPESQIRLLIPPIPIRLKYMVLIYIGLEFYYLNSLSNDHISHISHLLGVVFAVIMYNVWHYIDSNKA